MFESPNGSNSVNAAPQPVILALKERIKMIAKAEGKNDFTDGMAQTSAEIIAARRADEGHPLTLEMVAGDELAPSMKEAVLMRVEAAKAAANVAGLKYSPESGAMEHEA